MKIVIVGGGPAGFSAAMVARKLGADVTVIERTDALGGLGMVAGIALLGVATPVIYEERQMGGAALMDIFEALATHKDIKVPGVGDDVMLYNTTRLDAVMQRTLRQAGIEFLLKKPVVGADIKGKRVDAVILRDDSRISGDVFIDTSGATNGPTDCDELGRGCVECIYRCPAFGPPGGIVEKKEPVISRLNAYGKPGVIGTSVLIPIISLSPELQKEINEKGFVLVPVPPNAVMDEDRMKHAGAPLMFRHEVHKKNVILLDVGGHVKVTAIGSPMWAGSLRVFPGMEDAWIHQPTAGAIGHLVTWTTMAYRSNALQADGFDNLFVAGHKAGPTVCLIDAIVTGDLAGCNAARYGVGKPLVELPTSLIIGAFIDYVGRQMRTEEGLMRGYALTEIEILERLKVYRDDKADIARVVEKAGLKDIYKTKLL